MKFNNPLRKMLDRSDQIAALNESIDATEKMSDAGERLLRFREIRSELHGLQADVQSKSARVTLPALLGAACCIIGGGITANPIVAGAGFALMFGTVGLSIIMSSANYTTLWDAVERCEKLEKELLANVAMKDIAQSAKFETVMQTYPALKEKFMLAANREKVLSAEEPAAKPQTPRAGDTGFRI